MKKIIVTGILAVMVASFSVKAQSTNSTRATGNGTTPSASQNGLSATSGKSGAAMGGNVKTNQKKSDKRSTKTQTATSKSTVDGSTNGSATNDGASGQSGSPIANQSAAIDQGTSQPSTSTGKAKNTKVSSHSN